MYRLVLLHRFANFLGYSVKTMKELCSKWMFDGVTDSGDAHEV